MIVAILGLIFSVQGCSDEEHIQGSYGMDVYPLSRQEILNAECEERPPLTYFVSGAQEVTLCSVIGVQNSTTPNNDSDLVYMPLSEIADQLKNGKDFGKDDIFFLSVQTDCDVRTAEEKDFIDLPESGTNVILDIDSGFWPHIAWPPDCATE